MEGELLLHAMPEVNREHVHSLWFKGGEKVFDSILPVLQCLRVGRSIDAVHEGAIKLHYEVINRSTLNVVSVKQLTVTGLSG